MRPYLPPLIRSLVAPMGRMVPAMSHGQGGLELYTEQEGMTDRGNPYAFGSNVSGIPPHGYNALAGQHYSAIPQVHNHDAFGAPLEPRPATTPGAYVTPSKLWNLSGIAPGWSRPGGANPSRQPTAKMAMGRLGSLLAAGGLGVAPPLPTLPESQRMVQPQL